MCLNSLFYSTAPACCAMSPAADEAMAKHRREKVKIYSMFFTPLYHAITQRKFKGVICWKPVEDRG